MLGRERGYRHAGRSLPGHGLQGRLARASPQTPAVRHDCARAGREVRYSRHTRSKPQWQRYVGHWTSRIGYPVILVPSISTSLCKVRYFVVHHATFADRMYVRSQGITNIHYGIGTARIVHSVHQAQCLCSSSPPMYSSPRLTHSPQASRQHLTPSATYVPAGT